MTDILEDEETGYLLLITGSPSCKDLSTHATGVETAAALYF